jgi:hypothetical protein
MSMLRSLKRRVANLSGGKEPAAVVEALGALWKTGQAPEGPAGDRARELWEEAGVPPCPDDDGNCVRWLRCYLKATWKTLADVMQEEADLLRASARESDR